MVDEEKSEFLKSQKLEQSYRRGTDDVNDMITEDDDDDDDEGALAGENSMQQDYDELWKTAWSRGRGVLNSDRVGHIDFDTDASFPLLDSEKREVRVSCWF